MTDNVRRADVLNVINKTYSDFEQYIEQRNLILVLPSADKTTKNLNQDYDAVDQFVCGNCGIELQDWRRIERDEDDGDITYHEYRFRYCPNCGEKIEE